MKRVCAVLLALALTGCGDDGAAPDPANAGKPAAIRQGTISDAMIPLDQLESQAPLMADEGPDADALDADALDAAQPVVTPQRPRPAAPAPRGEADEAPAPPAPAPATDE